MPADAEQPPFLSVIWAVKNASRAACTGGGRRCMGEREKYAGKPPPTPITPNAAFRCCPGLRLERKSELCRFLKRSYNRH